MHDEATYRELRYAYRLAFEQWAKQVTMAQTHDGEVESSALQEAHLNYRRKRDELVEYLRAKSTTYVELKHSNRVCSTYAIAGS